MKVANSPSVSTAVFDLNTPSVRSGIYVSADLYGSTKKVDVTSSVKVSCDLTVSVEAASKKINGIWCRFKVLIVAVESVHDGRTLFSHVINASVTIDPPALNDGDSATAEVTVTGAALGDFVMFAPPYDTQGVTVTATVSAADKVRFVFTNNTGGAVDLAEGEWNVKVLR